MVSLADVHCLSEKRGGALSLMKADALCRQHIAPLAQVGRAISKIGNPEFRYECEVLLPALIVAALGHLVDARDGAVGSPDRGIAVFNSGAKIKDRSAGIA